MKWFLIRYVAICAIGLTATALFALLEDFDLIKPSDKVEEIMAYVAVVSITLLIAGVMLGMAAIIIMAIDSITK